MSLKVIKRNLQLSLQKLNNFHEDQSNKSDNQENVPKEKTSSALLQIKKNDNIQYKLSDSEEWISATVLGKAGKMTGKNKTWYNVQDHLSNEQKSVDLGRLEWNAIENLHRDEEVHTTDDVDDTSCEIAKQLELQNLCHFDTYEEVRNDIAAICEMKQNNYVEVKWCPGKVQLANSMTKRGASGIELLNVLQKGKLPEEFV